jgi:hypothetical protein
VSNLAQIEKRVVQSAETLLFKQHYLSVLEVFLAMGWLKPVHVQAWRSGKVAYLEKVIECNLHKITHAMKCLRRWALAKGLKPSETVYLAKTRGPKKHLRFSKSGESPIERAYRTHYVSAILGEKKEARLKERLERPPEPAVFLIVKESRCACCQNLVPKGALLWMEGQEPLCMVCAKLDRLVLLPSGNALLSRRSKQYSKVWAVVLKYSRTRKRYERQGLLVEEGALLKAHRDLEFRMEDSRLD